MSLLCRRIVQKLLLVQPLSRIRKLRVRRLGNMPEKNEKPKLQATTFIIPLPNSIKIFDGYYIDFVQPDSGLDDDAIKFVSEGIHLKIKERIQFRAIQESADMRSINISIQASKDLLRDVEEKGKNIPKPLTGLATVAYVSVIVSHRKVMEEAEHSDLFDHALSVLRSYLKAYYVVDRVPIELPSRMNLPPFVMVHKEDILPDGSSIAESPNIEQSVLFLHDQTDPFIYDGEPLEMDKLASAVHTDITTGAEVINATLDTYREASLAYRRGEILSASILFASSVEVFLDSLLLYLLWEEGRRPEDAFEIMYQTKMCSCDDCKAKMTTTLDRVMGGLYGTRIGGDWSKNSELMKLWREVAELRNKVVHTGVEPDTASVNRIAQIVPQIQTILTDYLVSAIDRYPLAAYFIAGQDGLERRGLSSSLDDYIPPEELKPVSLSIPFLNWKFEVERLNSKKLRKTTDDQCQLAFVIHPSGQNRWILYDGRLKIFRLISDQTIKEGAQQALAEITAEASKKSIQQTIIVDVHDVTPNSKTAKVLWYPMYRLSSSLHSIDRWPVSYLLPKE